MKRLRKVLVTLCMALALIGMTGMFKPVETQAATTLTKTKVKNSSFTFTEGAKKKKIKFKYLPSGATKTFKSSNKKVAKVTKYGNIYPKGAGSCTITCTLKYNGKTKKLKVYVIVNEAEKVTTMPLAPEYNLGKLWEQEKKDGKVDIQEINANFGDIIYVGQYFGGIFGFKSDTADNVYVNYTLEELGEFWDIEMNENYMEGIRKAGYSIISTNTINYGTVDMSGCFREILAEYYVGNQKYVDTAYYYECVQPGTFYLFYPAAGGHYQKITVSDKTSEGIKASLCKTSYDGRYGEWANIDCAKYLTAKTYIYEYKNGSFVKTKKTIAKGTKIFVQGTCNGYARVYWDGDYGYKCKNVGIIPADSYARMPLTKAPSLEMLKKMCTVSGTVKTEYIKELGWGDENGFYDGIGIIHECDGNGTKWVYFRLPEGFIYNKTYAKLFYKNDSSMKVFYIKSQCVEAHYACIHSTGGTYSIYYKSDKDIEG